MTRSSDFSIISGRGGGRCYEIPIIVLKSDAMASDEDKP